MRHLAEVSHRSLVIRFLSSDEKLAVAVNRPLARCPCEPSFHREGMGS